jgi:hypothetical protein
MPVAPSRAYSGRKARFAWRFVPVLCVKVKNMINDRTITKKIERTSRIVDKASLISIPLSIDINEDACLFYKMQPQISATCKIGTNTLAREESTYFLGHKCTWTGSTLRWRVREPPYPHRGTNECRFLQNTRNQEKEHSKESRRCIKQNRTELMRCTAKTPFSP